MSLLDHSTVLITGASSGIGKEFARQLAPRASTLILVARRAERLDLLKRELERSGLTIHCRPVDLSDSTEVEGLVEWLASERVEVNVLINNAGLGDRGRFENSDWERVRQMIEVNIGALTRLTHALLPTLKAQAGMIIKNQLVGSSLATAVFTIIPLPVITTASLPAGKLKTNYSLTLTTTGGATPYKWSLASGTLPAGLKLNATTGAITGTPTKTGAFNFTVEVTDANKKFSTKEFTLTVNN